MKPSFARPQRGPTEYPAPVHLSASGTIVANSPGGVNQDALRCPFELPIEVSEIKFQLRSSERFSGSAVGVRLAMGGHDLTNGYVPVFMLGRSDYLRVEYNNNSSADPLVREFSWKLPRPMYVPPTLSVEAQFQHRGLINSDIVSTVSISGKVVPKFRGTPHVIQLPWAACYASKGFVTPGSLDSDQSRETDLVNPFDVPVRLQRMVGRVNFFNTTLGYNADWEVSNTYFVTDDLTLRMTSSDGDQIVRTDSPFASVFSPVTRTWELDGAIMPPRSFWMAYLTQAANSGINALNVPIINTALISIVGHRDVALKGKVA